MEVSQKPFARKKPDQLVYLELGSGNGGMLLSISEDGFRFRAVSPLRPNGLMPFAFSFDGSRRLQGIGEVEWLEDDGKSGGMRFAEVSAEFRFALSQWLALDSPRSRPGREVTPAAATPLDTMEKIREELRSGHSGPPSRKSSTGKEAPIANPEVLLPKSDTPPRKQDAEPQPRHPNIAADTDQRPDLSRLESSLAEARHRAADFRGGSATSASELPAAEPPSRSAETVSKGNDRKPHLEHSPPPFSPPPFSQSEEEESPASAEPTSSAFLKKPAPAAGSPIPSFRPSAVPPISEPPQAVRDAHASAEALRRPFRAEPSTSRTERPYIPPPEQSFEAAWERAKLTTPPEAPHLSRAAAGSIIGIALAVILGALAFNFRQDIGELVIDLGQKISGQNHAAAPAPAASESQTGSQATADPANPHSAPSTRSESASSQAPTQTVNSAANPADTHSTTSPAAHDPAAAGRDASSSGTRGATSSSVPSGAASSAPSAAITTAPSQTTAENANTTIGTEPGSGQEDFNSARELLRGDHRQRDLSKAVDLLWAGVRKGYVPAEVTLADLYRRGDGVPKNCDQAQVLLVAASKKGSSEARHLLEQMAEEGCTE